MSSLTDISQFLVDGTNALRVIAVRNDGYPGADTDCQLKLFRSCGPRETPASVDMLFVLEESPSMDVLRIERMSTFAADIPHRWTWQDADTLEQLDAEDRIAIYRAISDLAAAYDPLDISRIKSLVASWVAGEDSPGFVGASGAAMLERARDIASAPEYSVRIAKLPDLEFMTGSKLVLVHNRMFRLHEFGGRSSLGVIDAGILGDEGKFEGLTIGFKRLYLFQQGGVWKILPPIWLR